MNTPNRRSQRLYSERMRLTHIKRHIWLEKEIDAQLFKVATAKGWLANSGCHAGKVNLQHTVNRVLEMGIAALEPKIKGGLSS